MKFRCPECHDTVDITLDYPDEIAQKLDFFSELDAYGAFKCSLCPNQPKLVMVSELDLYKINIIEKSNQRREELLCAFLAKYSCEPDDVVLMEKYTGNGFEVSARLKTPEEKSFERNGHSMCIACKYKRDAADIIKLSEKLS